MATNTPITIQRAITPKLLRFRIFGLVLFSRASNEARKLKKTVLEKIKKKVQVKGYRTDERTVKLS